MNWETIKEKYPNAFKAAIYQIAPTKVRDNFDACVIVRDDEKKIITFGSMPLQIAMYLPYHRRLYDFFDKCHIYMNTSAVDVHLAQVTKDGNIKREFTTEHFKTRDEAEYAAFELAFEWLEQTINEKRKEQQN